jgi:hypothetical protein
VARWIFSSGRGKVKWHVVAPTQLPVAPRWISGSGWGQVKMARGRPRPTSGGALMDIRFRPRTGKNGAWPPPPNFRWRLDGNPFRPRTGKMAHGRPYPTSGGALMDIRFRPRTGKNGTWPPPPNFQWRLDGYPVPAEDR